MKTISYPSFFEEKIKILHFDNYEVYVIISIATTTNKLSNSTPLTSYAKCFKVETTISCDG